MSARATPDPAGADGGPAHAELTFDIHEARRFLEALDEPDTVHAFQTFTDDQAVKATYGNRDPFAKTLIGTLDQLAGTLAKWNTGSKAVGCFVTVNEITGQRRTAKNVSRIRANFIDLDGAALEPVLQCNLEPHMVVESSPGRFHAYWLVDGMPVDQFTALQRTILRRFGGDSAVVDPSRVMRLPGAWHHKGVPFKTRIIEDTARPPYTAEQILAEFPPTVSGNGAAGHATSDQPDPNAELFEGIRSGTSYYPCLRDLAFRLIDDGMSAAKVTDLLRNLMRGSQGGRDEHGQRDQRWQARYTSIPTLVTSAEEKVAEKKKAEHNKPHDSAAFTDQELLEGDAPEPAFIIPSLIPEGLTLIAGRPKSGKTFFGMNLADACARGGTALGAIQAEHCEVLYLSLEDNRRRLRKRRKMMLDGHQLRPAAGLTFHTEWPRLDEGGLQKLEDECRGNPALKMIFIDTYKKVCPRRKRNEDDYDRETDAAGALQRLAARYAISIIIIHHTRKGPSSEDFIDDVLGSTGLTGAVDAIIVFRRKRGTSDAEIFITGRDLDEAEKALAGDHTTGLWQLMGDAADARRSKQRTEILDVLRDGGIRTVKELSDLLGQPYDNTRMTCARMAADGELRRVGKGYCVS